MKSRRKNALAIILTLAILVQLLLPATTYADQGKLHQGAIKKVTLLMDTKEISSNDPTIIKKDSMIEVNVDWAIEDTVTITAGDRIEYAIPDQLDLSNSFLGDKHEADLIVTVGSESINAGSYTITKATKKLEIIFNDNLNGKTNRGGQIKFDTSPNPSKFNENPYQEIGVKQEGLDKTYKLLLPPTSGEKLYKEGQPDSAINPTSVKWFIDINTGFEPLKSIRVNDTLPAGLVAKNIKLYKLNVSSSGEKKRGELVREYSKFPVDLGDIHTAYRIEYETGLLPDNATIKNKANLTTTASGTEVSLKEVTSEVEPNKGKKLEKKGVQLDKDIDPNRASWLINVNTVQEDMKAVEVIDQMPKNLELDAKSLVIREMIIDEEGNITYSEPITGFQYEYVEGERTNDLKIIFGDITKAYEVKYDTNILYEGYQENQNISNTAILKSKNFEEVTESSTITVTRSKIIKKEVSDKSEGIGQVVFDWKISVNEPRAKISNVIVKDFFSLSQDDNSERKMKFIKNSVRVYDEKGKPVKKDFFEVIENYDGIYDFAIKLNKGKEIDSMYTIEYQTRATYFGEKAEPVDYDNTAILDTNLGIFGTNATKTQTTKALLYKYFDLGDGIDYSEKKINWSIYIDPLHTTIEELKIIDNIPKGTSIDLNDIKVIQITKPLDNEPEKREEITSGYRATHLPDSEGKGFTLVFSEKLDGKNYYEIKYSTLLDIDNLQDLYTNSITFKIKGKVENVAQDISTTGGITQYISPIAKNGGAKSGKVDAKNRKIDWDLHINFFGKKLGKTTIEDTVGPGQKLEDLAGTIKIYEYALDRYGRPTNEVEIAKDAYRLDMMGADKFRVTLNDVSKPMMIKYHTIMEGVSQEHYTNAAVLNDGKTYEGKVRFNDYKNFVKKGVLGGRPSKIYLDDEITWQVVLNKSMSEISAGAVFKDKIASGHVYLDNSLDVYYMQNDKKIKFTNYKFTKETIGDAVELQLTFNKKIDNVLYIDYKTVVVGNEVSKVENTAELIGKDIGEGHKDTVSYSIYRTPSSSAHADYNRGKITIKKIDDLTKEPIKEKAEFILYYMLNGEERIVSGESKFTENGLLTYNGLQYRTYYLKEIRAPKNYYINEAANPYTIELSKDRNDIVIEVENSKEPYKPHDPSVPGIPKGEDPKEDPKGEDPKEDPKGEDPKEDPKGEDPKEDPRGEEPKEDPEGENPETEPQEDPKPYKEEEVPDPNDPRSPEEIVLIDDTGKPLGRYVKKMGPNDEFIYVNVEDGIPLGQVVGPRTGDYTPVLSLVIIFIVSTISLIGLMIFKRKKQK